MWWKVVLFFVWLIPTLAAIGVGSFILMVTAPISPIDSDRVTRVHSTNPDNDSGDREISRIGGVVSVVGIVSGVMLFIASSHGWVWDP